MSITENMDDVHAGSTVCRKCKRAIVVGTPTGDATGRSVRLELVLNVWSYGGLDLPYDVANHPLPATIRAHRLPGVVYILHDEVCR